MKFDWSGTSDPMALQPGTYRVEITASEEKQSKTSSNLYWQLTFKALDYNCKLCHDNLMLTGDGKNIAAGKLSALGFKEGDDVEAGSLVGLRLWISVKEEPAKGEYKRKLVVDIGVKGSKLGYWATAPANVMMPTAAPAPAADDTPF